MRDIAGAIRAHERASKAYNTLNLYDKLLAFKPDLTGALCVFCGKPATNNHHVIPRSRGGNLTSPLFSVCGNGNMSGCHGLLHKGKMHIRWNQEAGWYEYRVGLEAMTIDQAQLKSDWVQMERREQE